MNGHGFRGGFLVCELSPLRVRPMQGQVDDGGWFLSRKGKLYYLASGFDESGQNPSSSALGY